MNNILIFLKENYQLIIILLTLVFGVIAYFKTGSNKLLNKSITSLINLLNKDGGVDMEYRTENYQDSLKKSELKGQTFSNKLKTYHLNKVTDCLEEDGVIDLQELVNSCVNTCLDEVLTKFFPETQVSDGVGVVDIKQDDLDVLQESFALADKYRGILGLSPDTSVADVFKAMEDKRVELSNLRIDGDVKNEKKINEEEKQ